MTASLPTPADVLRNVAKRLERLSPSPHDPERYFEEKDSIVSALKKLAAGQ
jgi:hypothetical protein